jgi:phage terminase Nu1 subunit (DNA packaging protein)
MTRTSPVGNLEALPPIVADDAVRLLGISLVQFNRLTKNYWIKSVARNRYLIGDVVSGYLKFLEFERTRGKTANETANHIDITQRRLFALIDQGIIERAGEDGFDLTTVRLAYIRNLRKVAAGSGSRLNLGDERALLARAQRIKVERENAVSAGQLVDAEIVGECLEEENRVVRDHFLNLPGTCGYDLAASARAARDDMTATIVVTEKLKEAVYASLTELSDPEKIAQRAVARGRGDKNQSTAPEAATKQ